MEKLMNLEAGVLFYVVRRLEAPGAKFSRPIGGLTPICLSATQMRIHRFQTTWI
jgi:hypothetical protein